MTVRAPGWLGAGMAAAVLAVTPGAAWAHWSIVSELRGPGQDGTFQLQVQYELMAGQANPDEPLEACFWVERHEGNQYLAFTEQKCERLILKPNEGRVLTYSLDRLPWLGYRGTMADLPSGHYRAVVVIRSDVNPAVRFFVGASQDRKVAPFDIE